jgi:hypothetical protein
MKLLFVSKVYQCPKKGTVDSRNHLYFTYIFLYFLFMDISNRNFTLLSEAKIYNPEKHWHQLAPKFSKIKFPKWNYKILL